MYTHCGKANSEPPSHHPRFSLSKVSSLLGLFLSTEHHHTHFLQPGWTLYVVECRWGFKRSNDSDRNNKFTKGWYTKALQSKSFSGRRGNWGPRSELSKVREIQARNEDKNVWKVSSYLHALSTPSHHLYPFLPHLWGHNILPRSSQAGLTCLRSILSVYYITSWL